MTTTWVTLALLASQACARAVKRQESNVFIRLGGKYADGAPVSQCDEVEVTFGGGVAPYTFSVWSAGQSAFTSETRLDTEGTAIWSIQSGPTKLALYLRDSGGANVQSQLLEVVPGTESCYDSTPVLRTSNQLTTTISQTSVWGPAETSTVSPPLPTPTSPTNPSPTSLED
ncbi:hypothetical protein FRC11_003219, partial [Ceratobasidium sp. 423]